MRTAHVDHEAVARRWRECGFSCGLWVDPPSQVWADYVHVVDELVMIVEGDVEFEIEGRRTGPRLARRSSSRLAPGTRSGISGTESLAGCTATAGDLLALLAARTRLERA
jgi:hypothetical protein